MELAVRNTYFQKKEEQQPTYKSKSSCAQVDYMKEMRDCKVIPGESVTRQYRMVIAKIVFKCKEREV